MGKSSVRQLNVILNIIYLAEFSGYRRQEKVRVGDEVSRFGDVAQFGRERPSQRIIADGKVGGLGEQPELRVSLGLGSGLRRDFKCGT